MGYFGGLISDLGSSITGFDADTDAGKKTAGRYINKAAKWIYSSHPWEWRYRTGAVTLIPNYTTGTCAVTVFTGANEADARTVTFSTALPSNIQGRFFRVSDGAWHKIQYASGSTAYLETPITETGTTFEIWKRFYHLPGDVASIMDFLRWDSRWGRLEYKSFSNLADQVADVSEDG